MACMEDEGRTNGLDEIPVTRKTGEEPFVSSGEELPVRLSDFWSWANSDLVNNVARGTLAEFLVAHALGLVGKPRVEWDAKDLEDEDGTQIEVKSSAYVQSWYQKKYSSITFDIKPKRSWDPATNEMSTSPHRSCDIYVFCLLHRKDKDINPLNMDQWEFYVVSTRKLNEKLRKQETMVLSTLRKLAKPVPYDKLPSTYRLIKRSENYQKIRELLDKLLIRLHSFDKC